MGEKNYFYAATNFEDESSANIDTKTTVDKKEESMQREITSTAYEKRYSFSSSENIGKEEPKKNDKIVSREEASIGSSSTYCVHCGAEIKSDELFCSNCGTRKTLSTSKVLIEDSSVSTASDKKIFCTNCGAENERKDKYCIACGTPLHHSVSEKKISVTNSFDNTDNYEGRETNNQKDLKGIFTGIGIVVAIIAIFAFFINLNNTTNKTIDLNNYLTVEFEGCDGYGKAYGKLDWDAIAVDYGDKVKFTDKAINQYGMWLDMQTPIEGISDRVSYNLKNAYGENNNLSNGDTVEISWSVDNDLSDYIDCKVKYHDELFVVSGLDEYVASLTKLTQSTLDTLDNYSQEEFYSENSLFLDAKGVELVNFEHVGNCLLTAKDYNDDMRYYNYSFNKLYLVYKVTVHLSYESYGMHEKDLEYYWYYCYHDLIMNQDNSVEIDYEKCSSARYVGFTTTINGWGHWVFGGYEDLERLYDDFEQMTDYNFESNITFN